MGLLENISLPTLRFVSSGFDISIKPTKTVYKKVITFDKECELKQIEVYVKDELIDTIPHEVYYNKNDTLHLEYQLYEKHVG